MRADRNGDGRIEWEEMLAFVREKPMVPDGGGRALMALMMSMDADGDGSVMPAEFDAAVERVFRAADADADGVLSKEEGDRFRVRKAAERDAEMRRQTIEYSRLLAEARLAACAMPKASDAAKVILLQNMHGDALSTVTLMSQDIAVDTGQIIIEAGEEPLYLIVMVGSGVTIWRIAGAVERVERLVVAGRMTEANRSVRDHVPLAGATGVAADRVTLLGRPDCIPDFFDGPSERAAAEVVRRATGREPMLMRARGRAASVAVPSGQTSAHDREPHELIVRDQDGTLRIEQGPNRVAGDGQQVQSVLRRFHQSGIVEIDPAAVVASHPVERYATLPQAGGLLQLLQSGALAEGERRDRSLPKEFVIRRKIRFPAGLYGPLQVKFVVPPGVPLPDGDPGHSCVMMQRTGQVVANTSSCRLEAR